MAPKTRGGVIGRCTGGRRAHETNVSPQETPEIEETQVPPPDTATPPQRNMVTMSVEELQNLLQTTMTSQVTNIVDAVLTNRSRQGHRDQFTSEESRYLRDFKKYDPPQFGGRAQDTEAAEGWLEAIESAFKYMNCPDTHKSPLCNLHAKGPSSFLVGVCPSFFRECGRTSNMGTVS